MPLGFEDPGVVVQEVEPRVVVQHVPSQRPDVLEGIKVANVRPNDAAFAELVEEGARFVDAVHRVADLRFVPPVDDDAVPRRA